MPPSKVPTAAEPPSLWRMPAWQFLASVSVASCFAMTPALLMFGGPPGLVSSLIALASLGSILAQGCLLAAWLAWGDRPFGRRLLQHWTVAAVLCLVWLTTMLCLVWLISVSPGAADSEAVAVGFTVAMTVPLISVAAQFPLWCMRQMFGWRLVRLNSDGSLQAEQLWSIRDLFLATLIVAVAFGIARLSPAAVQERQFWVAWLIGGSVACVITSITILPAAVLLLRIEPFQRGVRYSWLYAWSYVALLWLAVAYFHWLALGPLPHYFAFIGLSGLILSFAGTVILAAKVARARGYRLVTRSHSTVATWTFDNA